MVMLFENSKCGGESRMSKKANVLLGVVLIAVFVMGFITNDVMLHNASLFKWANPRTNTSGTTVSEVVPNCPVAEYFITANGIPWGGALVGTFILGPYSYSERIPYWISDEKATVISTDFNKPILAYSGYVSIRVIVNASISVDVYNGADYLGSIHGSGDIPSSNAIQNMLYLSASPSLRFGNPNPTPIVIQYNIYGVGHVMYMENATQRCLPTP
jgi:hypothetical protein